MDILLIAIFIIVFIINPQIIRYILLSLLYVVVSVCAIIASPLGVPLIFFISFYTLNKMNKT